MGTEKTMLCSEMFREMARMGAGQAKVVLGDENDEPFGGVTLLRGEKKDVDAMVAVAVSIANGAGIHVEPGEGDAPFYQMHTIAKEEGFEFVLTRDQQDGEEVASVVMVGGVLTTSVNAALSALEELWWAKMDEVKAA